MKSFERRTQVARAIQRELGNILQSGLIKDDRLSKLLSIVKVDLNSSLSSAIVLYSIIEQDIGLCEGAQAALNEHAGRLRGMIGRKLNLRYAPKLVFTRCESLSKGVDMVYLINQTIEKDQEAIRLRNND
jgi:ribosome-binding factor A